MEALAPRSDQLNADDLIPGPRVLKFTDARIVRDGRDTKIVVNFEGDNGKPWKPCKTMGRAMVMAWGITDEKQLIGKSVRVYRDADVKFGDQGAVGGIRISHMSHLDKPAVMKLTVSQGKKGSYTFNPLLTEVKTPPADQLTVEDAEQSLRSAADLDALKLAWASKAMRPFRERLQSVLDERKAALTQPSNDTDDLIASFERVTTADELAAATKAMHGLDLADDADVQMAREAAQERIA